jgi:hypothetical protein
MVSKSTTLIAFRFPVRYGELLAAEVLRNRFTSRAALCRQILARAVEVWGKLRPGPKKILFYDKRRRELAKLSGKSNVIAVRVSHQLAQDIRELAARDGKNVSELAGLAVLNWLNAE